MLARQGGSGDDDGAALTIEFADLGQWAGATLIAEYDPEDDAIRIDRRAVARIRTFLGEAECERFIACAIAHERYHREHPFASEAEALAWADRATGSDSSWYARVLSAAGAEYSNAFTDPSAVPGDPLPNPATLRLGNSWRKR
jgi:hypothetical protein